MSIYHFDFCAPLPCSLCGREISQGEEYWICNGTVICTACLADYARQMLSCCRLVHGKEMLE